MKNFEESKPFFFACKKSNQTSIEAGVYLPPNRLKFQKSDKTVISLEPNFNSGEAILAGIQTKKDVAVTLEEYSNIISKWNQTKIQIENELNRKEIKVKFVLFIFNESMSRNDGKVILWKQKSATNEVIVFFTDINNKDFFLGNK